MTLWLILVGLLILRPGSVRAFVDMEFPSNLSDPLKPLRDAMQDGKLGMFVVDPQREINPSKFPLKWPPFFCFFFFFIKIIMKLCYH